MNPYNIIMKKISCLFLFVYCFLSAAAQIDYVAHPDYISDKNKTLKISWINSSPINCIIDFNHFVEFHNVQGDRMTGSKVQVVLYKNEEPVKSYLFSTGSGILNRIYVPKPVPLRKGDSLYFVFTLVPETEHEEFVFNIFQKRQDVAPIRTPQITAQTGMAGNVTAPKEKVPKQQVPREKYGEQLKKEHRKDRLNRTMTSLINILGFLL